MSITRRNLILAGGLGTAGLTLAACGGGSPAKQDEDVTDITVVSGNNPWVQGLEKHLDRYAEETGVAVHLDTYGNEQLNDQYKVKLNASDDTFDVMVFQVQDVAREFARNGWLLDVTDRVEAESDWGWDDFQEAAREAVTVDDVVLGVPLMTERHVVYYRKDLLEKAGMAVPTTLDELEAAAEALHDPGSGMSGIAMRGQAVAAVTQFSSFLYSFGGDFQADGASALNSDAAIAAYDYYGRVLREFGPEGVTSMGWVEASALFAQGRAAFYLDADSQAYTFLDESSSSVVETVDFAPFPAGPAGSKPYSIVPWTAGINSFSRKQDAAWKFITWATSQGMLTTLMSEDTLPSPRQSSWDDDAAAGSFPAGLVTNVQATLDGVVGHDRPQVEQVAQAREYVGAPIIASINGEDVPAAATKADEQLQELIDAEAPA
ncbi:ABC transporter substrate-binding protein [Brachybacterium ginsengisoli]|uniref:ABC transporter substrate-binding protein n=1 Tax=Brachybacterium ginsengisoli TaxID=1331682 RepID=A0A291H0K1_9MICO|nr:sugar ABC transporter substrate-binding protein [Brachybacterium ginsengisoli]ATG55884.1 ABC transporter substrate-binding protein [Brachybacterium ginsengisoli]